MKKVLTKFLAISSVALLMLSSCKKNDALVTSNGGKAGTLSVNTTTPVLDKNMLTDTTSVVKFSFTAPSFGYSAIVTNTLQIDAPGDNWKNPTSFSIGANVLSQGFSTSAFNSLLLKMNLPAYVASTVSVRVQHAITSNVSVYTNVLSVTATPFNLASWVYVVGAFQGWNTSSADSIESATGNGVYTGVIYFPPNSGGAGMNQFLILPTRSFNTKYATTASPDTTGTGPYVYPSEFVTSGGNNFAVKTSGGHYIVTLDNNANTLTLTPSDYYTILGDVIPGSNWSVDTQLKYINDGSNVWAANNIALTVGGPPNDGFKVRYDGAWNTSWGWLATPDGKTLTSSGDTNIGVTAAGNYDFSITVAPTAFGGTPPATLPYTLVKQ